MIQFSTRSVLSVICVGFFFAFVAALSIAVYDSNQRRSVVQDGILFDTRREIHIHGPSVEHVTAIAKNNPDIFYLTASHAIKVYSPNNNPNDDFVRLLCFTCAQLCRVEDINTAQNVTDGFAFHTLTQTRKPYVVSVCMKELNSAFLCDLFAARNSTNNAIYDLIVHDALSEHSAITRITYSATDFSSAACWVEAAVSESILVQIGRATPLSQSPLVCSPCTIYVNSMSLNILSQIRELPQLESLAVKKNSGDELLARVKHGCMDKTATNYDPSANEHVISVCSFTKILHLTAFGDLLNCTFSNQSTLAATGLNFYEGLSLTFLGNSVVEVFLNGICTDLKLQKPLLINQLIRFSRSMIPVVRKHLYFSHITSAAYDAALYFQTDVRETMAAICTVFETDRNDCAPSVIDCLWNLDICDAMMARISSLVLQQLVHFFSDFICIGCKRIVQAVNTCIYFVANNLPAEIEKPHIVQVEMLIPMTDCITSSLSGALALQGNRQVVDQIGSLADIMRSLLHELYHSSE
eukprot:6193765-Pleurochrysis_carterae.AAC.2